MSPHLFDYLSLSVILTLFGFVWRIATENRTKVSLNDFSSCKEEIEDEIRGTKQDISKRVTYQSFDRYKDEAKKDFQTKDVCSVLVDEIKADLKEIKADLKYLIRKNGG